MSMRSLSPFHLLQAFSFVSISLSQNVTIDAPISVPSVASHIVNHAFPGLAIESVSFFDFAGNSSFPNILSRNLISVIQNKTGSGIVIRVGGTSGDHDHYNASQTYPSLPPPTPDPAGAVFNWTLGPSYYEGFANFPGTNFTWQVPINILGPHLSVDALAQAKQALQYIPAGCLSSLEIGNEPDLYLAQGVRGSTYSEATYVQQWLETFTNLVGNFSTLLQGPIFQALAFSSGVDQTQWNASSAFGNGINSNGNVASVSYHHYQVPNSDTARLGPDLMNHTAVAEGLDVFRNPIAYMQKAHPEIPFVIGEVNSALGNVGNAGLEGIFGGALWGVDMMLYAMSINVTRLNMQQGNGFQYAAWQPDGPHIAVKPPFYALAFVADFIGTGTNFQATNIDLGNAHVSAYAGYDNGQLSKIAIVNLVEWNSTKTTTRPVQNVAIDGLKGIPSATVQYLTGAGADVKAGVNWAGIQWTVESVGMPVRVANNTQTIGIGRNGELTLSINASEAIMVNMMRG